MNKKEANVYLKRYIKCIEGFFIQVKTKNGQNKKKFEKQVNSENTNKMTVQPQFKGLFQMDEKKGSKPLAISEIYKIFLQSFLLTKPLYIAIQINKAIKEYDTHTLLEIVCTQKFEDLEIANKLMEVLYPRFKIDFRKFSKNQNVFDHEKLEQFLNWRFDKKCERMPIIEKVINL